MNESLPVLSQPESDMSQQFERLRQAGQITAKWAALFNEAEEQGTPDHSLHLLADKILELSSEPIIGEIPQKDISEIRVEDLNISVRLFNRLVRNGIITIGDLLQYSYADILRLRDTGPSAVNELRAKLNELGVTLREK
jgi:DNA-directed RNA polymerase alpha subunit